MKKRERGRLSERLVIFAIAASLFLGAATMVQADIGSSEITTYETGYVAGTTNVNLNFHISAQSPDWEYVWYAEMDFPPGVTVNSATDMIDLAHPWRYMYWNGETGDGALTTWGERSYWEYLYDSECDFIVNVDIDPGFSGDLVIDWYLEGDGWGSPPHTVSGSIVIPEAVLDVGVTAINSPQPLDDVGTIPVEVQVKNFGPEVTDVPVRVVISTGVKAIFIDEDFEGSFPPSGWTVTNDGAPDACVWMRNIDYGRDNYMGTGVCADADADACGSGGPWPMDTSLITPSIDLTLYTNAYLEFDAYYNHLSGDFAEGLISPDGGITWDTLFHWSSDHYDWPYHYVFDISAYCGNPNVIIKFRYFADSWDWYWLLDNVKVWAWAPGTYVEHYNETVYVDLLAGESKPVSLPDWVCTEADWYVILGCTELPGDLNSTNDCTFVVDMPIGDLDLGVTSIDIPRPLMGPIPFKPEATVEHFGDIYVKDCPVRCTIEQLGVLKFKEDFEPGVGMEMRVGALDAIFDRHPRELGPDQVCGIRIEWEDGIPQLGDITDWTILDLDGDGITWHATSYRYSSPVTSAYCGDETDHLYENGAFDWLISPQINVGTGGYIEWDMWQEVETFCDYVFVGNSANGINFWGYLYLYNTVGWEHFSQNLVPSGIAADGTTYIAFVFISDSSVTYEGTYVDNVEVYGGGIVYDEYVYEDFDGGDVKQVVFPTFTPEADTDYEILICTEHPLDEDTSNDCQGPMDFNTGARVWNTRTGYGYDNIQDAIDDSATLDGDTIVAKDGENFYENINIYKQLTVTGQYPPTGTTTIYGTVDITSDNVTFQNFKVIPDGPYTYPEAAIEITCVSHVVVQNNIIEDMTGEVSSATGVFNISGIWVHCDDPTPRPPIPPYYGNVTIYNNTIRNIVNTNVTEPGILLFSEDFEGCYPGPSPPSGWLVEDTNGDGYIYGYYAYNMWGSYYSSFYAHSGSMSMRYEYNSAMAADDWFFTHGISLEAGKTYMLQWWDRVTSSYYTERMAVYIGTAQNSGAMTTQIWDDPSMTHTTYRQDTATFSVPTTGTYYIGFHAYSAANMWNIYVDDIELYELQPPVGGADGIRVAGRVDDINIFENEIYDIHSAGWCYGVEVTPTTVKSHSLPVEVPVNVNIEGNYFTGIGDGTMYSVWDNPDDVPYPGVMVAVTGCSYAVADATQVMVHENVFDPDCYSKIYAIINEDSGILDATNNWYGMPNGPASDPYHGDVVDPVTGYVADGYGCNIYNLGPVHFDPWIGVHAEASASKLFAETGETIVFNGEGSWAKDFNGLYEPIYYWGFDDGTYSYNKIIGHVYDTPGTYNVYLRVEGHGIPGVWSNLMYDWDYLTITVYNPGSPLSANADAKNFGGYETTIGEAVQLYGSASGGTPPYSFYWDVGDNRGTITEQNPLVVYREPGVYTVTLTVIDSEGSSATDTSQVTVHDVEELSVNVKGPANAMTGELTLFNGEAFGGVPPYTYYWDFGDGTTSAEENPRHVYEQPGTYTVTLTVTDSRGSTATDTMQVTVHGETQTQVEIKEIKGGLGVSATITAGENPVNWEIDVTGGFILFGGHASGTIPAGAEETVKTLIIGFGKIDIHVCADTVCKDATAFLLGPLVLNLQTTD